MAFTVKKNPTQKFQYEQGMISGMQFKEHSAHLHRPIAKLPGISNKAFYSKKRTRAIKKWNEKNAQKPKP